MTIVFVFAFGFVPWRILWRFPKGSLFSAQSFLVFIGSSLHSACLDLLWFFKLQQWFVAPVCVKSSKKYIFHCPLSDNRVKYTLPLRYGNNMYFSVYSEGLYCNWVQVSKRKQISYLPSCCSKLLSRSSDNTKHC